MVEPKETDIYQNNIRQSCQFAHAQNGKTGIKVPPSLRSRKDVTATKALRRYFELETIKQNDKYD